MGFAKSSLSVYADEIKELFSQCNNKTHVAKQIIEKYKLKNNIEDVRSYVRRVLNTHIKHKALENEVKNVGIPLDNVKYYWHKGEHFSIFVENKSVSIEDVVKDILAEIKQHAPKYQQIKYPVNNEGHLLVIDPADIHINKLCSAFETGDAYNTELAVKRVLSGVYGILEKAKGFHIDQILFIVGNDILHTDNSKSTTTSGTHQDTELMWYDAFQIAVKLMVECIEILMNVAPVVVQYNPSNHDYLNGFFMAQTLQAWFNNSSQITFNASMSHRKYFRYHSNLIGSTHGDGAREQDLALLMAHESKEWNECKNRYFYVHHIHHKKSKDYMSVCVEALRSPSGTDSWHHRNGYTHAPKAIEGFIHHKQHGQIARLTHLF